MAHALRPTKEHTIILGSPAVVKDLYTRVAVLETETASLKQEVETLAARTANLRQGVAVLVQVFDSIEKVLLDMGC
jgi:cell division protein FtsB